MNQKMCEGVSPWFPLDQVSRFFQRIKQRSYLSFKQMLPNWTGGNTFFWIEMKLSGSLRNHWVEITRITDRPGRKMISTKAMCQRAAWKLEELKIKVETKAWKERNYLLVNESLRLPIPNDDPFLYVRKTPFVAGQRGVGKTLFKKDMSSGEMSRAWRSLPMIR